MDEVFETIGAAIAFLVMAAFTLTRKVVMGVVHGITHAVPRARAWHQATPVLASKPTPKVVEQAAPAAAVLRRNVNMAIKPGFTASVTFRDDGSVDAVLRSDKDIGGKRSWFLIGTKVGSNGLDAIFNRVEKLAWAMVNELLAGPAQPQAGLPEAESQPVVFVEATGQASLPLVEPAPPPTVAAPKALASRATRAKADTVRGRVLSADIVPSVDVPEGVFMLVVDQGDAEPQILCGDALQDAWDVGDADVGDTVAIDRHGAPRAGFDMGSGAVQTSPVSFTVRKEAHV